MEILIILNQGIQFDEHLMLHSISFSISSVYFLKIINGSTKKYHILYLADETAILLKLLQVSTNIL